MSCKLHIRSLPCLLLPFFLTGCQDKPLTVRASISADKPIYTTGKDEVQIDFAAVNNSDKAVPQERIRDEGVLIINGQKLQESSLIFGNGIRSAESFLNPGRSMQFNYQLTSYFKKAGNYEVVWKGPEFETKPIFFRVLEPK